MVMVVVLVVAVLAVLVMVVLMLVAAALAVLVMVMVVVLVVAVLTVLVMVMLMLVAAALAVLVVIVVVMLVMMVVDLLHQSVGHGLLLNGGEDGLAVQLIPGGGEDDGLGVLLTKHGHRLLQLLLGQLLGAGEEDGAGGLHLIVVELAEVLHVDVDAGAVAHHHVAVEGQLGDGLGSLLHRADDVGQLAHAGGLDEDAVGLELLVDILQSLSEIAHQSAADAAGVHLGDLHAGLLQEAAVNADLTEFVFDEDDLFAHEGLGQQLFDEGGLAGAQKAGDNVDFCHVSNLFSGQCPYLLMLHYSTSSKDCKHKKSGSARLRNR